MTPAIALPVAALRVLRMAARWRVLRVAVFLGALLTLGFVCGEHAEAAELPGPSMTAVPSASSASSVTWLTQPRDDVASPIAGIGRPRTNGSGDRFAKAVVPGTDVPVSPAHVVRHVTGSTNSANSVEQQSRVIRSAAAEMPVATEATSVVAHFRKPVVGVARRVTQSVGGFAGAVLGPLPPAPSGPAPLQGVVSPGPPHVADARTVSPASAYAAVHPDVLAHAVPRIRPACRSVNPPGPPSETGRRSPLPSPTGPRGADAANTTAGGRHPGGDSHAAALPYGVSPMFTPGGRGLPATTAPLLERHRDLLEFPG